MMGVEPKTLPPRSQRPSRCAVFPLRYLHPNEVRRREPKTPIHPGKINFAAQRVAINYPAPLFCSRVGSLRALAFSSIIFPGHLDFFLLFLLPLRSHSRLRTENIPDLEYRNTAEHLDFWGATAKNRFLS